MAAQTSCLQNSKGDQPYKEDDYSKKRARQKNYQLTSLLEEWRRGEVEGSWAMEG